MTKATQSNRLAAAKGSGEGGESNAAGTATGLGSSPASRSKKDSSHRIAGNGSEKAAPGRPGRKAYS